MTSMSGSMPLSILCNIGNVGDRFGFVLEASRGGFSSCFEAQLEVGINWT